MHIDNKKITRAVFSVLSVVIILMPAFTFDSRKLSVHMESQRAIKGKIIRVKADIYYAYNEGKMISHYTYPDEYFLISNVKGEVKVYKPSTNQVSIQQNDIFSIQNDVLYYFVFNKIADMGLKDLSFTLDKTRFENDMMISDWIPPVFLMDRVSRIELVHEKYLPIYTAYYNSKKEIIKKIYYYDYLEKNNFVLPQKIAEIEYLETGDSIVSRKIYSDTRFDKDANSEYFDFKIPGNAKLMNVKK